MPIIRSSRLWCWLPHWSFHSWFAVITAPNLQPTANQGWNDQCGNQHHSRELLMMGIIVPKTCWAYKKCNKITSGIFLVFLFFSYHNDARSIKHQINEEVGLEGWTELRGSGFCSMRGCCERSNCLLLRDLSTERLSVPEEGFVCTWLFFGYEFGTASSVKYLLLLLPLAVQPTVGFGLSNNVLPFLPIYHQLSSSSHSQHLKISFYFLFPSFTGSSPSSRPFQFLSEDLFGLHILLHSF